MADKKDSIKEDLSLSVQLIERKIYLIRNQKVMLDSDLAELYEVETRRINEQVKRNVSRFPEDFMFRLTQEEYDVLTSQIATSTTTKGGRRHLPYAFTEQGVAMLSSVLNSERAVQVNIAIMRTFVKLRQFLINNEELAKKIELLTEFQDLHSAKLKQHDDNFKAVFDAIRRLIKATIQPSTALVPQPKEAPKRKAGFINDKQKEEKSE